MLTNNGVRVQAHVLPYMTELRDEDWNLLGQTANKSKKTLQSGFYIYRVNRLIVWGKWFGIVTDIATRKLARVELDIDSVKDEEWNLDVRKSRAEIPTSYHPFIVSSIVHALERSRRKIIHVSNDTSKGGECAPLWIFTENKEKRTWALRVNRESQLMNELKDLLAENKVKLNHLLDELEAYFPYEALRARYQSFDLEGGDHDRE